MAGPSPQPNVQAFGLFKDGERLVHGGAKRPGRGQPVRLRESRRLRWRYLPRHPPQAIVERLPIIGLGPQPFGGGLWRLRGRPVVEFRRCALATDQCQQRQPEQGMGGASQALNNARP